MPQLPESARLWLDRAEIDYIGPFVKAWASFNAWYREASNQRRDADGLHFVKNRPNHVRSTIMPLIQPIRVDDNGNHLPDDESAQKFKLLIRDLHVRLDNFHIEVTKDDVLERISFRSVFLGREALTPQSIEFNRFHYHVDKASGKWKSSIWSIANTTQRKCDIEQDKYNIEELQNHPDFVTLSVTQRDKLLALYRLCNPRPMTDLFAARSEIITAGDIEFRCTAEHLFCALIEIIYAMRNALLHGELQPHEQAFQAYEPAYRIVMEFLKALRG
ncbi:MAG: hypothetical protein KME13_17910 [Myxacorys californica WJT36-NPBG1]|jgi:hypothetical protein|nr:hypothetical protein [Myxacorys californica WJT36-NPBG1]